MPNLGLIALVLILLITVRWFWHALRVNIPRNFQHFRLGWAIGLALGLMALYQSPQDSFAAWAVGLGLLFVYLISTGAQKVGVQAIGIGDDMPVFSATDENGENFDSSRLAGKRVLLKFFRGHW